MFGKVGVYPGRTVTVFQKSQIFCEGYNLKDCIPTNEINRSRRTGIFPFVPEVFSDYDILAAEITGQTPCGLDETEDESRSSSRNVVDLFTDVSNKAENYSNETQFVQEPYAWAQLKT